MRVIDHFCLNWRMAKLSPSTTTFPDQFWAPLSNQTNLLTREKRKKSPNLVAINASRPLLEVPANLGLVSRVPAGI